MINNKFKSIGIIGAGLIGLKHRGEISRGLDIQMVEPNQASPIFERGVKPTIYKHTPPRSMTADEKAYYQKHKTLQGFNPQTPQP